MNAHDLIKEAIAEKGKFDSVYWIACGGSMIDLIPAHELLQREATTFTSYIYTAREFDIMRPRRLGEKSLVIACSHSGNTPEVVEGCEIALAAGATVIAQTDNAGSKIDSGKWTTWVYPWGEGVPQAEVPAGISLIMDERALAFLKTHTDTLMVLDAKEYGMEAVPASVRAYLDPVLFYAMNCELRAARGKVFDHDPDFRRYMGVVEY